MTGNQLAEAMGVSFSDVGRRLQKMPFKLTGEQGVRSTIKEMIEKESKSVKDVEQHVGSWGSSWLLKAAADDKQGQMPAGMDPEKMKQLMQEQQAQKAEL
jgi:hypothetical protein